MGGTGAADINSRVVEALGRWYVAVVLAGMLGAGASTTGASAVATSGSTVLNSSSKTVALERLLTQKLSVIYGTSE